MHPHLPHLLTKIHPVVALLLGTAACGSQVFGGYQPHDSDASPDDATRPTDGGRSVFDVPTPPPPIDGGEPDATRPPPPPLDGGAPSYHGCAELCDFLQRACMITFEGCAELCTMQVASLSERCRASFDRFSSCVIENGATCSRGMVVSSPTCASAQQEFTACSPGITPFSAAARSATRDM